MQDSALVRKLGEVVSKRLLKFLDKEATDDAKKYARVLHQASAASSRKASPPTPTNREAIAKLLRFESSMTEPGKTVGLTDYVKRMKEGQTAIYYQIGSEPQRHRGRAVCWRPSSRSGYEVLFLYEPIDEYVISNALR
jgi:TNF receptor-associated protein 1